MSGKNSDRPPLAHNLQLYQRTLKTLRGNWRNARLLTDAPNGRFLFYDPSFEKCHP